MTKNIFRYYLILLLFTFCFSAEAKFIFEGLTENQLQKLKQDLPYIFNGSSSPALADQVIRYLIKTNNFQVVSAFNQGDHIQIIATPIRTIRKVDIIGSRSISKSTMFNLIQISPGDNFEKKVVFEAGEKLKELYSDEGFFNTHIEVTFSELKNNMLNINFNIQENKPCKIINIHVDSGNKTLNARLSSQLRRYKKDLFSQTTIKNIENRAKEYFKKNYYLKAEIQQNKVQYNSDKTEASLFYTLKSPYSYDVVIEGNQALSGNEIRRNAIKIDEYQLSSIDPKIEFQQETKQLYLQKGFPHIQVLSEEKLKEDSFKKIIYINVSEGKKIRVGKFEVTGRISKPSKFYVNFIKNNSSELIKDNGYNRKDLNLGYENLITHLKNQGFLKAKIQSARVEYNQDKSSANISVVMDEGPLTQIRKIRFHGNKDFSSTELSQTLALTTNTPLRLNHLEESIKRLKLFYNERGYLEMALLNENENLIQYNSLGTEANLDFKIYEGPQVTIGSISIDGNDKTEKSVILREMNFQIGDILTQNKIEEARRRLNLLGLFSRIDIRTLEAGTKIAKRTLIVSVDERVPGLVKMGVGLTSEDNLTLRGFLGTSYNNLWGTARALSLRGEVRSNITESKFLQNKISFGYLEPFLFNSRTRGRVNLIHSVDETDFDKAQISTIKESNRIDFILERELSKHLKLTWTTWSTNQVKLYKDPTNEVISNDNIATLGPLFELDFRDNPYLPHRGTYTKWATQYSSPNIGSSDTVDFIRTESNFSYYIPVFSSGITWASAIRGGYLKNLSTLANSGVPASHTFYLHGQSKLRGFGGSDEKEHIPNGTQFNVSKGNKVNDESYYYLYKTEFRAPIPNPPMDIPLALSVFYDIGAVVINDADKVALFDDPVRQSFGLGIHINTPLGPIILEFARKISPRDGERRDRFHFAIGTF